MSKKFTVPKKAQHLYKGGVPKTIFNVLEQASKESTDFREIARIAHEKSPHVGTYDMRIYLAELERQGFLIRKEKGVYEWHSAIKQS